MDNAITKLEEKLEEFYRQHPEVAQAMDAWARSSVPYEEAMRRLAVMPVVYSGGTTTAPLPLPTTCAEPTR